MALSASLGQHRGAAFGDLDGDGRLDAVVTRLGEAAELWHNASAPVGRWLEVRLEGRASNRDGFGSRIRVVGRSVRSCLGCAERQSRI